ncbi:hypothetical protein ACXN5S_18715 [Pseudoroseicyclus sp. H15]
MTNRIPPPLQPEGGVAKELADAVTLLGSARSRLATLLAEIETGNAAAAGEAKAEVEKLFDAVRRAFDVEAKYNDWHAKQSGLATGGELDLADIRHQIGCRLARLRSCGGPG